VRGRLAFFPRDCVASTHERDQIARMPPAILCLIVLAMPLAVAVSAVFAAWAERRPVSANPDRLNATAGDGFADIEDDGELFR